MIRHTWTALAVATTLLAGPALAQAPAPAGASWIEAGGFHHHVGNDFGDWNGGYVRGVFAERWNTWYADAKAQRAFGDDGAYFSLANVASVRRLMTQFSVGAGTGKYVLPDLRIDAGLGLKLGSRRNLILWGGGTYVRAKSVYTDKAAFGSLVWYPANGVVMEVGGRINWSNPDAVRSERVLSAVTLGHVGRTLVVLRGGAGTEGYQLTGTTSTLRRFRSQEAAASLRQWAGRRWGFVLGGEFYHNPFYDRAGASLGVFRGW